MRVWSIKCPVWLGWPPALAGVALPLLMLASGCAAGTTNTAVRPPAGRQPAVMTMEVTGYCSCGVCCSWYRPWFGFGSPVISKGPNKGKPKAVGMTASGVQARRGTVAADTAVLPFGTVINIPGYGYGRVEDRGGAIKGNKLDLWFPSHEAAKKWGRQTIKVQVWKP